MPRPKRQAAPEVAPEAPEIEHVITETDLTANPELVGEVEVGETVTLPPEEPVESQFTAKQESALEKIGFTLPKQFVDKHTKKTAQRWGLKELGSFVEVYQGSTFVRVYSEKDHGKDYKHLAQQLVDKKNKQLV